MGALRLKHAQLWLPDVELNDFNPHIVGGIQAAHELHDR